MSYKKESPLLYAYNRSLHPHRVRFNQSNGIEFFGSEQDSRCLHSFLMFWTGYSISMTRHVESWIRGAGESCARQGMEKVGQHLQRHAHHEKDHDQMLVADLKVLVQLWNDKYGDRVSAAELETMKVPTSTHDYAVMHEEVIKGRHPYCQIAIEFEIERLSITVGPQWVENVVYTLGQEYAEGLTFLTHHVVLDQGHTQFNSKLIENCLKEDSARLEPLVQTGQLALEIYGRFLKDCVEASKVLAQ